MEEQHVSGTVSAFVILAAIATAFTTYSSFKEEEVAQDYEAVGSSLEQAANVLMSQRQERQAAIVEPVETEIDSQDSEE